MEIDLTEAELEALRRCADWPHQIGDLISREQWDAQNALIERGILQICTDIKRRDFGRIWPTESGRALVERLEGER